MVQKIWGKILRQMVNKNGIKCMIQKRQISNLNGNDRNNNFSTYYLLYRNSYKNFSTLIINRHNLQKFNDQRLNDQGNEIYKSYGSKKIGSDDQRKR